MGEFRHRDEKLVIVVQVIHYIFVTICKVIFQ